MHKGPGKCGSEESGGSGGDDGNTVLVGAGRRRKGPAFGDESAGSRARERGKSATGTGRERTRAGAEPDGGIHGRAERAGAPEADATSVRAGEVRPLG
jgi:hypothetical protein